MPKNAKADHGNPLLLPPENATQEGFLFALGIYGLPLVDFQASVGLHDEMSIRNDGVDGMPPLFEPFATVYGRR